jgi:hypothetical protein
MSPKHPNGVNTPESIVGILYTEPGIEELMIKNVAFMPWAVIKRDATLDPIIPRYEPCPESL